MLDLYMVPNRVLLSAFRYYSFTIIHVFEGFFLSNSLPSFMHIVFTNNFNMKESHYTGIECL